MSRPTVRDVYMASPDYSASLYCGGQVLILTHDLTALSFVGKSTKPAFQHRFKSLDERDAYVAKYVAAMTTRLEEREAYKAQRRANAKADAQAFKASLKPGVILTASWGYEQTQVEFFRVESIKGATVTLQELGHIDVGATSWASCYVMPDLETTQNDPITVRLGNSAAIKLNSSIYLTVWDGTKSYKSWYA